LNPSRKRACVEHVRLRLPVSLLPTSGAAASLPQVRDDETALTAAIERLATQYGRYGYRRIRRMQSTKAGE
jgi:hypothetical protein